MWHDPEQEPKFSEYLELDLGDVVPSIAGPKRPQDRIQLSDAKNAFRKDIHNYVEEHHAAPRAPNSTRPSTSPSPPAIPVSLSFADDGAVDVHVGGQRLRGPAEQAGARSNPTSSGEFVLDHGAVVVAAITSCTNTSNPSVMLGAALLAKNAVEKGLTSKPWVKTSMAPGSQVVSDYYDKAGVWPYLEKLGFFLVGYGCTTCIGNTGPLPEEISKAINDNDLSVTAVLSGNRNFEGRISPDVKMNYLASPPLVIAYALAGTMDFDFETEAARARTTTATTSSSRTSGRRPRRSRTIIASSINQKMFTDSYADVFKGDERWRNLPTPEGKTFDWDPNSTYVRKPPYFDGMPAEPDAGDRHHGRQSACAAGRFGDHRPHQPGGQHQGGHPGRAVPRRERRRPQGLQLLWLASRQPRGDDPRHVRQHPAAQPARSTRSSGGYTRDFTQDGGPQAFIYDASQNYAAQGIPLVVLGGKEYGSGSSRDWAAKGTSLLGVRAVITESFERIHRSNLIGMGVIPLQFPAGESAASLKLDGTETFDITGIEKLNEGKTPEDGEGHRHQDGRFHDGRVRRGRAHRHPRRGRLLPQRRHPAVRAAQHVEVLS